MLEPLASVRRLEAAFDEDTLAEEVLLDAVRRDKDVGGLGLEFVFAGAQEAKAFLGDFEVAGTYFRRALLLLGLLMLLWFAHICNG